jgi:hypothetical protein
MPIDAGDPRIALEHKTAWWKKPAAGARQLPARNDMTEFK